MNLRLIGAAAVMFSTTVIGFCMSQKYRERPRQLRDLIDSLQQLVTEVSFGMYSLPEAFAALSRRSSFPIGLLYSRTSALMTKGLSVEKSWSVAVTEMVSKSALTSTDAAVLQRLAVCLGRSDRNDQVRHLQYTIGRLTQAEVEALRERDRKAKLSLYLGWGTGVCTVILLY